MQNEVYHYKKRMLKEIYTSWHYCHAYTLTLVSIITIFHLFFFFFIIPSTRTRSLADSIFMTLILSEKNWVRQKESKQRRVQVNVLNDYLQVKVKSFMGSN